MSTTPETEWENQFDALMQGKWTTKPEIKIFVRSLLTSRDTYWKEQLQKAREEEHGRVLAKWNELYGNAKHSPDAVMHGFNVFIQRHHSELEQDKK